MPNDEKMPIDEKISNDGELSNDEKMLNDEKVPNNEKMFNDENVSSDVKMLEFKEEKKNEPKLRKFMTHVGYATIGYILAFDAAASLTLYPLLSEKKIQKDAVALKENIASSQNEIAYLKQKKERYLTIYNNFINAGKRWEATIKEDQQYYDQITEYMRVINQPRLFNPSQTVSPAGTQQAKPEAQTVVKNKVMQAVRQVRERE